MKKHTFIKTTIFTLFLALFFTGCALVSEEQVNQNSNQISNFEKREEKDIVAFDSSEDKYKKIEKNTKIIYQLETGIWLFNNANEEKKHLIPLDTNEELFTSVSPGGDKIVYNIFLQDEKGKVIDEGIVKIYNLKNDKVEELFDVPDEKILVNQIVWNEAEEKFYYTLMTSEGESPFPYPDKIDFYEYDLNSRESRYIAKATDFNIGEKWKAVNREIKAISPDGRYLLIIGIGEGDPGFISAWKVDSDTFEIKRIYNVDEVGLSYPYLLEYDPEEGIFIGYDSSDDNKHFFIKINVDTEKIDIIEVDKIANGKPSSIIKDNDLIVLERGRYANEPNNLLIFDTTAFNLKDKVELGVKKSISDFTEADQVILRFQKDEDQETISAFNIKNREVIDYKKFIPGKDYHILKVL